jgi:hypothetical protein
MIALYVYIFDKFGILTDEICGCFTNCLNWSFEILFSIELALARSAKLYTNKYRYIYITSEYDNSVIGPISKSLSVI